MKLFEDTLSTLDEGRAAFWLNKSEGGKLGGKSVVAARTLTLPQPVLASASFRFSLAQKYHENFARRFNPLPDAWRLRNFRVRRTGSCGARGNDREHPGDDVAGGIQGCRFE